ncbi:hypothetical protein HD806DRAFT_250208 [Xylariaceae sp. AK1471]|nr:hypothetical protein HD806DRAFT_250208 [Xylariaceae sp. AK1471]
MPPHSLPHPPPSPTQSEYQSAIQFYYSVRDEFTLHEAEDIGGRPFILVDNVTSKLIRHGSENHLEHGQISRLLEAAYRRFQYSQPQQKSYQILEYLPIFYTLLDLDYGHTIHEFFEEGVNKLPVELPKLEEILPVREYRHLAERFYKRQWQWCAMKFEWRMSRKVHSHEQIVPITARTKIEPARDGLPKVDRKASLWVVEVPTSFVDEQLEEKLRYPDDDEDEASTRKADPHYRFVVKRFSEKRKDEFDSEKNIFNTIDEKEGIVRYIGWYTHCEKDPDSDVESTYYNLVLELGDQDLYSAFQKENPPITFAEIQTFWQSMFDVADALASIQVLDSDRFYTTYLWHGDIKPENILDVRGRFKLADPGEAQVKKVRKSLSGEGLKMRVPGGTRSFAAPEKFTYEKFIYPPERPIEPEVTQGSDIWSLGCVFSVAATYVVLGKEGVKQYRLLRQRTLESEGVGVGDPFHNKKEVLSVVTLWHKYLKSTVRKDDCYTAKILDVVDNQMLIIPGARRISGADLSRELKSIDNEAVQTTDAVPDRIAEFIDEVMRTSKGSYSELEDVPRTISKSGTELFSEELLYPSRRSEGRPIARQMQPDREDPLRGIGSGLGPVPVPPIPERVSGFFTPAQRGTLTSLRVPTSATPRQKPPEDPPTTFWEVEADLVEYYGKSYFKKRTSIYGKELGGREDQLEHHFRNRDLVYLVDNASSMKRFWRHASHLLRVLVWRSLGYDDNGMELRFTDELEEKWRLTPKRKQRKEDFAKKMDDADPNKRKNSISKTDMSASLSLILEDHLRKNSDGTKLKRHLTILVLTDGLWEMNGEFDIDNYLLTFIQKIPEENWEPETPRGASTTSGKPPSRPRPISIQFIRFGHHPNAIVRLDRLDNNLKDRPELLGTSIPDVIDTESADGDVYKMFLGSFIEDFDNKAIQGAAIVSSTSGKSITSPTNGLAIGGTSPSEYETTQIPIQPPQTPISARTLCPSESYQHSSTSGRSSFLWSTLPLTYTSARVPRASSGSNSGVELGQESLAHHYRQGSEEYAVNSRPSAAFSQYQRPRGESQGQQSKVSSPLTPTRPYDPFGPG